MQGVDTLRPMSPRVRLTLMVAGTLSLAAIAAVLAFAVGDKAAGGTAFRGAARPPDIPPAEFGLRDQDGEPVRLRELRGRPVVVTFLYTTCEETCPLTAAQIRGALDVVGHDVPVVAVSVDPPRDTADRARRFLLEHKMTGRMRFLLGERGELARLWKAFGIQPQGEGFEHSASTVLLDARGRQRVGYFSDVLTPDALAADIRRLEAEARGVD